MQIGYLTRTETKGLRPNSARYSVSDGGGLSLEVQPSGVKSWRVRYRLRGVPRRINVGRWPDVSLDAARELRDKVKTAARAGMMLAEFLQQEKLKAQRGATARQFGERYMREIVRQERKNPNEIRRYFERDIFPKIGELKMREIGLDDLREIIFAKRDAGKSQAALAVRDLLKRTWDYAVVCGVVDANPLQALKRKYVAPTRSRKRSLSADEVGELMQRLRTARIAPKMRIALTLVLLNLVRKSELLLARWEHIDLKKGEWTIPPEHTKNGLEHVVYLSLQSRRLLAELTNLRIGRRHPKHFVIESLNSHTQPISESTLNRVLARVTAGMKHFTVHDLRRTASTLLSEDEYQADVIEKALNHTIRGVRGVYNRAQFREQRKRMLQNWADKIEDLAIEARGKFSRGRKRDE